ncbi:hypothetical protein SASPL_113805 [Salvia splendens]|uniref:Protein kinase domain-containing protein n=1 Tax=Salvia splendens TaxID=180675 RepID=A0A8X8Y4C6_SALSN|nr:hypothetical protein SASPL_113805 [Salvia splendens]
MLIMCCMTGRTDTPSSDYCVWRGIGCDNATFNVVSLNLSGLNLDGEISHAIGQLKSLVSIDLRANQLSGQIPDEIGDCSSLESLVLKNNQLIGHIPSTLSQIPNLKILDLAQNRFSGEIPRLLYWNEVLQYLGLRGNNLQGSLSPDMCQLTGLCDVRNNSLSGSIPENIGNCNSSLQNNHFSGQIPSVIGLMQALAVLDLSFNMLSGTIPPILGNLTYTEKLYLHANKLTGSIPPELGNMTKLHYLYESQLLMIRNVHGNKLNGTVPLAFQRLKSMTYLNLSSNNLRGPIPIELSRIGNLDTLDLSNNKISGDMPSSLGDLEHLLKLNLRNNSLTGYIPAEFGNLRSIMEVKLEYNNISGDVMNVSYNNLVGFIPTAKNFSRFPPESFVGNPGLCGYWLSSNCRAPRPSERVSISKAAILGIALGAMVILLMILFASCRPHHPKPFTVGPPVKLVNYSSPKLVILHMNMALHVYEDIIRMTENLSEKYVIGYGASSTVYKCVLKNCRPVAVKKLYSHYPQCLKEFETELNTVGSIKHRNLVSLQG